MKILIRLPNWLGDLVMSMYFVQQVRQVYPNAYISVIVKNGLQELLPFWGPFEHVFPFSKKAFKGITGLYRFGQSIHATGRFDVFFCLPDSFSSAFMGWATRSKYRVGYAKELRSLLLTQAPTKHNTEHRVMQYLRLLGHYSNRHIAPPQQSLLPIQPPEEKSIIINVHSEAISRRLPVDKACELINCLRQRTDAPIILIGGPADKPHTDQVLRGVTQQQNITNKAGLTSIAQLVKLFATAGAMLSTDSGPAHLANAVGLPVVVLFGAGNEVNTRPFYSPAVKVLRLGQLSCEPCVKNTCIYGLPKCLQLLNNNQVVDALLQQYSSRVAPLQQ